MALNSIKQSIRVSEFSGLKSKEFSEKEILHSAIITRVVLRALRRRLSVEQSFRLIPHLPADLKAVYIDGWSYSYNPIGIRHIEDFMQAVKLEAGAMAWRHFSDAEEIKAGIYRVFKSLVKDRKSNWITFFQ